MTTTEHSIKANCKRGYSLLKSTQAELTKTQMWTINFTYQLGMKQIGHDGSDEPDYFQALSKFLTDLQVHIMVHMPTTIKPYTNKKGVTSNKHYNANGKMINGINDKVPVLIPTWFKFDRTKLVTRLTPNSSCFGKFDSLETQTLFHLKVDDPEDDIENPLDIVNIKPRNFSCADCNCYVANDDLTGSVPYAVYCVECFDKLMGEVQADTEEEAMTNKELGDEIKTKRFQHYHHNTPLADLVPGHRMYIGAIRIQRFVRGRTVWLEYIREKQILKWRSEFSKLKVVELKKKCKEMNMKGYSKLNKSALIEVMIRHQLIMGA